MLFTGNPADRMQQMAETAAIIAEPVRARHTVTISGRQHVRVEGWTMLGALLGVHPYLVWSRPLCEPRRTATPAGKPGSKPAPDPATSSAAPKRNALRDEKTWAGRDDYALRSMAQTRATSKAMRQPLGFIITLAGFDPTPAEEMPTAETFKAPAAAGGLPITEPQQKKIYLLRDKLVKAGVFTQQAYDESMAKLYGTQRVNELNREQATGTDRPARGRRTHMKNTRQSPGLETGLDLPMRHNPAGDLRRVRLLGTRTPLQPLPKENQANGHSPSGQHIASNRPSPLTVVLIWLFGIDVI